MKEMQVKYIFTDEIKKKNKKNRFGNLLFTIFLTAFLIMFASQISYFIPELKTGFQFENVQFGLPLSREEYLYERGMIEFQLMGMDTCPDLKVLVNGEEREVFNKKEIKIDVIDGDIIEMDGSGITEKVGVIVSSTSDNMTSEYMGHTFQINGNIQNILKIDLLN